MALPLWDSPAESRFLPRDAKARFGRVCRKEMYVSYVEWVWLKDRCMTLQDGLNPKKQLKGRVSTSLIGVN